MIEYLIAITSGNLAGQSWHTAVAGGALIGLAATIMMATVGRVTGISTIFSSTLNPSSTRHWQWAFVCGLLLSGLLVNWLYKPIPVQIESPTSLLILAGLLVGFGARLGNGCTSGHGICGIARLSPRSLVATLVFMSIGMITVAMLRQLA